MNRSFKLNEASIAQEDVDGEVIAIDFRSGVYFSFRDTAADLWRLALEGRTLDALCEASEICTGNKKETRCEVEEFFSQLVSLELLIETDKSNLAAASLSSYSKPVVEKFEDMSEFIKLDPIHEVSSKGWPHVAA